MSEYAENGEPVTVAWRIRTEVLAAAREAFAARESARRIFGEQGGYENARVLADATGYWHGLCKAVEILDALVPQNGGVAK